jgi:hypothetical protein
VPIREIPRKSSNLSILAGDGNPIELLAQRYMPLLGLTWRIVPRLLGKYVYYFTACGTLKQFDYSNATLQRESRLIPDLGSGSQGVWYEEKFYFFYKLNKPISDKNFEFGVFSLETKKFSTLKLPDSITPEWMHW